MDGSKPYVAYMLPVISVTLMYVHALKDSYPSLQNIGIQRVGRRESTSVEEHHG
jgi:hypothetical protein